MGLNIRIPTDRLHIAREGYKWVVVEHRAPKRGEVVSRHRTYEAANKAARNRDLMILDVAEAHTF